MSKIKVHNDMKMSDVEYNRMYSMLEYDITNIVNRIIKKKGLVVSVDSGLNLGNEFKPAIGSAGNYLSIGAGHFVDKIDPELWVHGEYYVGGNYYPDSQLASGTYTLRIKRTYTYYETGSVNAVNNSAVIIGTGTEFTKLFLSGRRILINGSFYRVLSVQSDTQLTLTAVYPGATQSGLSFGVGAFFPAGYPADVDGNVIYYADNALFTIESGESPAICSFTWNKTTGKITALTDLRKDNLLTLYDPYNLKAVTDNIKTDFDAKLQVAYADFGNVFDITENLRVVVDENHAAFQSFAASQEQMNGELAAQILGAKDEALEAEKILFTKEVKIIPASINFESYLPNTPSSGFMEATVSSIAFMYGAGNGTPYTESSVNIPKEYVGSYVSLTAFNANQPEYRILGVKNGNKLIMPMWELNDLLEHSVNVWKKGRRIYRGTHGGIKITKLKVLLKDYLTQAVTIRVYQESKENLPYLKQTVPINTYEKTFDIQAVIDAVNGALIVDLCDPVSNPQNSNAAIFMGTIELYYSLYTLNDV
jgi:hypothetical protein